MALVRTLHFRRSRVLVDSEKIIDNIVREAWKTGSCDGGTTLQDCILTYVSVSHNVYGSPSMGDRREQNTVETPMWIRFIERHRMHAP